jgi:hypothetical protein
MGKSFRRSKSNLPTAICITLPESLTASVQQIVDSLRPTAGLKRTRCRCYRGRRLSLGWDAPVLWARSVLGFGPGPAIPDAAETTKGTFRFDVIACAAARM